MVNAAPARPRVRRPRPCRAAGALRPRGFTYLGLLLAVAILGIGLTVASEVWVKTAQRHKREQLEWVGQQFVQAIGSYRDASPGAAPVYPANLDELLEDRRYVTIKRHLRALYPNPFTGQVDWEPLRAPDGRIRGVRARLPTDQGLQLREFVHVPLQ